VLGAYFNTWRERYEASTDNRMLERMAILHYDQRLTAATLAVWRQRTAGVLTAAAHWVGVKVKVILGSRSKIWCLIHIRCVPVAGEGM
jgi:hypothetical protein